jgi:hypothetical protein
LFTKIGSAHIRSAEIIANQSEWQFNALPGKAAQTIECQADIRMQAVPGSGLKVFDTEQPDAKSAQVRPTEGEEEE